MKFTAAMVLLPLAGALSVGRPAPQTPAQAPAQTSVHAGLVGTWKVDRRQLPDDKDVWRRRVDALSTDRGSSLPSATGAPDPMMSAPVLNASAFDIALLRTAMRDLLETAERLTFQVKPDSVTIVDDLKRSLTYATTGAKEKRQLAATKFDVKTRWTDQALTQELTAWSFGMTEVYLPKEDGEELLVSIKVDKPQFQPPIKNIDRIYTRVK